MPRTRRRLSADVRREQILETASELFIKHGFENVKMADIAEQLETSRPNIYTYYPSTEAILEVILERRTREYIEELTQTLQQQDKPEVAAVMTLWLKHRDLLLLLHNGGGPNFYEYRRLVADALDKHTREFLNLHTNSQEAKVMVTLTRVLGMGAAYELVLHPEVYDLQMVSGLVEDMLKCGYGQLLPEVVTDIANRSKK